MNKTASPVYTVLCNTDSPSPAMTRDYLGRYLTSQEAWLFQIFGETRCLHLKARH